MRELGREIGERNNGIPLGGDQVGRFGVSKAANNVLYGNFSNNIPEDRIEFYQKTLQQINSISDDFDITYEDGGIERNALQELTHLLDEFTLVAFPSKEQRQKFKEKFEEIYKQIDGDRLDARKEAFARMREYLG